ncbi:MAG: MBL fold metallo-hydrolase [Burkholderiales bacterium]
MFTIEMLPSAHGDGLYIEYGATNAPHRVLIDGGTEPAYKTLKARIERLDPAQRHFELLVITHVDADHIGGIVKMLEKRELGATFDEVWFNGFPHLDASDTPPQSDVEFFGAVQGERLSTALLELRIPWNHRFNGGPVRMREDGALPSVTLDGGMRLTVMGPTVAKLAKLKPVWEAECRKAGLDPLEQLPPAPESEDVEPMGIPNVDALAGTAFVEDVAPANGSSISLLAEFEGKRVLLGADAHPRTLIDAIDHLEGPGKTLALSAFKLPHHASQHNVSSELLSRVKCAKYLVSTNGAQFKHPDREAIARVIKHGGPSPKLFFNYETEFNRVWQSPTLQDDWSYAAEYGDADGGLVVKV